MRSGCDKELEGVRGQNESSSAPLFFPTVMDSNEDKAAAATAAPPTSTSSNLPQARKLSCTKCFDALWFCYSPFHQMQQYYRYGSFDTCFGKWNALFDCLSLKTKRSSEVQDILEAREKTKQHIWTYRTVEEASVNWWMMYGHVFKLPPKPTTDS